MTEQMVQRDGRQRSVWTQKTILGGAAFYRTRMREAGQDGCSVLRDVHQFRGLIHRCQFTESHAGGGSSLPTYLPPTMQRSSLSLLQSIKSSNHPTTQHLFSHFEFHGRPHRTSPSSRYQSLSSSTATRPSHYLYI